MIPIFAKTRARSIVTRFAYMNELKIVLSLTNKCNNEKALFFKPLTDIAFPTCVFFSIAIPAPASNVSTDMMKLLLVCRDAIIFEDDIAKTTELPF